MADGLEVESTDFGRLARDVSDFPEDTMPIFRRAAVKTATSIKETARKNATGLAHAPRFPSSISYDFAGDSHGGGVLGALVGAMNGKYDITMEIGPDKDRPQGALGNLIEYGSLNNPPQGIMHGALQAHERDFERNVDNAVDEAWKALGL